MISTSFPPVKRLNVRRIHLATVPLKVFYCFKLETWKLLSHWHTMPSIVRKRIKWYLWNEYFMFFHFTGKLLRDWWWKFSFSVRKMKLRSCTETQYEFSILIMFLLWKLNNHLVFPGNSIITGNFTTLSTFIIGSWNLV